jgi:serine/threonine protein kinase
VTRSPSARPNADAIVPARIGARYDVIDRLGRGGSAVVYRVRDRGQPAEFALKQLLAPGSMHESESRGLFEREFHVLAQLKHPSAVEVYDFGVDAKGPFYTMELLDGGDLSARAPMPLAAACQALMQVCPLLSLLHARGFVHRDVTPRNVRFTREGAAKLIDFGAMVRFGPCAQGVGTPGFVAPEVVHHLRLDARTDLFSVGATLYYALTGQRPFAARTLADLNELFRGEPVLVSALVPGTPPALDALIASLLQVDPARRPSSAFEVMQRLAALCGAPLTASSEIAHAYLSLPLLVGR